MNYSTMCLEYMEGSIADFVGENNYQIIDLTSTEDDLNINFIIPSLELKGNIASVFFHKTEGFFVSLSKWSNMYGETDWYALSSDASQSVKEAFAKYQTSKGVINHG